MLTWNAFLCKFLYDIGMHKGQQSTDEEWFWKGFGCRHCRRFGWGQNQDHTKLKTIYLWYLIHENISILIHCECTVCNSITICTWIM